MSKQYHIVFSSSSVLFKPMNSLGKQNNVSFERAVKMHNDDDQSWKLIKKVKIQRKKSKLYVQSHKVKLNMFGSLDLLTKLIRNDLQNLGVKHED